ncbi:MAG: hypothetical protein RLZZ301_364 [Bacteroidota bacterium]
MKLQHLLLIALISCVHPTFHSQIQGTWHSNFQVAGKSLLMDLQVEGIGRDGAIRVAIPDQPKLKPQVMEDFVLFSDSLWFDWKAIGLNYAAHLQGDSLVGTMTQSGLTWKAVFYKTVQQAKTPSGRPQDPKAPFPYSVAEIEIAPTKKIKLSGTLILPELEKSNAFPLVIMVSGSGPQDRDCEILGHRPFWVLADYLGRNGIASFRYDDRGTGKSGGAFASASQLDFASDLVAIVKELKQRYPKANIFIYGHSEGGMTALRAAVQSNAIVGIIEAASVGTSGKEVLIAQQYLIPKASGLSENECRWNQRIYAAGAEITLRTTQNEFLKEVDSWLKANQDSIPVSLLKGQSLSEVANGLAAFFNNDWARQFLSFETESYLKQLTLPFLILNGANDIQVPATENQAGFRQHLSPASLEKSTLYIVPGLNHLFQHCQQCAISEYATLDESIAPEILSTIQLWVAAQNAH